MDATANDVPDEVSGFPTIKLYPAGAKDSPVDYSGSRTVEDLAKFIKEHGKHKVDAYAVHGNEDVEMSDVVESMPQQAPAATEEGGVAESIKSAASEATEAVKVMAVDSDDGGKDEL